MEVNEDGSEREKKREKRLARKQAERFFFSGQFWRWRCRYLGPVN
jgi:hypothetical protein